MRWVVLLTRRFGKMNKEEICSTLKKLREEKRMTVRELSEKAGITYQSLSKIENGQYNTGIDNICKIVDALGCRIVIIS